MARRRSSRSPSASPAPPRTQYSFVVEMDDLTALLFGAVTPVVRAQVIRLLHPDVGESKAEYVARLEELRSTR